MLRAWGWCLTALLGISFSLAYGMADLSFLKDSQWEQGKKFLAEGKAREAKETFAALVKRHPQEPDLYLLLGISSLRLRAAEAAEIYLKQARALAPDHVEARTLLGWIDLEVRKDYASAVKEYTRVIELRPDFAEPYNNLGVAFKKKGEGEARSDFEQALKINPRDEGALYGMPQVLREARDYAGAQKALSGLMGQSPNFVYWLEWGELQLVRYYWALLLIAAAFVFQAQYKKARRKSPGGW